MKRTLFFELLYRYYYVKEWFITDIWGWIVDAPVYGAETNYTKLVGRRTGKAKE